jgi:hypothetical protein
VIAEASGETADTYEGQAGVEEATATAEEAMATRAIAEDGLALGSLLREKAKVNSADG